MSTPGDAARPLLGEPGEMRAPRRVDLGVREAEGLTQAYLGALTVRAHSETGGGLVALGVGHQVDERASEEGGIAQRGREGGAPALAQAAGDRRPGGRVCPPKNWPAPSATQALRSSARVRRGENGGGRTPLA